MSESMSDLEKDIEESRARLDRTIDRIQDRLTPGHLVDEMLGTARVTPLNGLYDSALEAVRRNPVPVLLIAAGIGMLLKSMSAKSPRPALPRQPAGAEATPVMTTGTARTYDPDQPAGRPAPDVAGQTTM